MQSRQLRGRRVGGGISLEGYSRRLAGLFRLSVCTECIKWKSQNPNSNAAQCESKGVAQTLVVVHGENHNSNSRFWSEIPVSRFCALLSRLHFKIAMQIFLFKYKFIKSNQLEPNFDRQQFWFTRSSAKISLSCLRPKFYIFILVPLIFSPCSCCSCTCYRCCCSHK